MRSPWPWLVAIITAAVWAPTLGFDWVHTWDDGLFFTFNPQMGQWSWRWMATTTLWGHWMPLFWLTAHAEYLLWGFRPGPWHAVNVLLHTVSAVLLYQIARRLIGSPFAAFVAALLFAVHPLRMESVAWITELKDVLVGVLVLSAVLLWLEERRGWAFGAFLFACLSKSPAVLLPVLLLVLDGWRYRGVPWRFRVLRALPLVPFVAVSAVVTGIAFYALGGSQGPMPWSAEPLGPRLWAVAYSQMFYVAQTVWPARLSHLIEFTWLPSWNQPQYPLALAACVVWAWFCLKTWRRWPAFTAASVAYTVLVFPQAGLFQNGPQLVANRYSYLACVPFALLAGGAVAWASRRLPLLCSVGASTVVVALAAVTLINLPMWKDGDALWHYAATHEPTCTQCQDMAAGASLRQRDFAQARRYQEQAIRVSDGTLYPRFERHWNLAAILLFQGDTEAAAVELRRYLALVPPDRLNTPDDRSHVERARAMLVRLESGR